MLIECGHCGKITDATTVVECAKYECKSCNAVNEIIDFSVKEWLGFNYSQYLASILAILKDEPFDLLRAYSEADKLAGKLAAPQIEELKLVLADAFKRGESIRYLAQQIRDHVAPGDFVEYDANGEELYRIPESVRNVMIARTETTRTANLGAERYYKQEGIKQYAWVSSTNACPDCMAFNGKLNGIGRGDMPPLHPNCRCTIVAITGLEK